MDERHGTISESHHLLPLSWGGPNTPENLGRIKPNLHYDTHALLNEYVRHGGLPPASMVSAYSTKAQELAAYAWANREPNHPTPYWLPAHAPIHVEEADGVARVKALMEWGD